MQVKDFSSGPKIPPENIPAAYLNVGLMIYAELRIVRAQLSHLIEHTPNQPLPDVDAYYSAEAKKLYDEVWVSLLSKLGK